MLQVPIQTDCYLKSAGTFIYWQTVHHWQWRVDLWSLVVWFEDSWIRNTGQFSRRPKQLAQSEAVCNHLPPGPVQCSAYRDFFRTGADEVERGREEGQQCVHQSQQATFIRWKIRSLARGFPVLSHP
ncbi:hypothetical protein Mapa_014457 [Marchantia paleacea]|nr:hypothetical protein Mapa_014457 [Marchantia paleacea]